MTIKKGDRVRLLRDNGWPGYGKKGEVGTVTEVYSEAVDVAGIGEGNWGWRVPLAYLELVAPPATTLTQAHDAGLLTAWLGEALGPCVPCGDEALVVRGRLGLSPAMCAVGGDPSMSQVETRSAVLHGWGWELYDPQCTAPFAGADTEAQALAWCARGVRP